MPTFTTEQLKKLSVKMFKAAGASDEQAETVTEILLETSLFGIDSHGVRSVPEHVKNLKMGKIRPDAKIKVIKDTMTTAFWEGGQQYGHVVAKKAMDEAIRKAESYRIGWVSTVSEHIGALYYYSLMAAKKDLIGITTCRTTGYRVTPYGGKAGRLGTNPLAICIPAFKERPILLDMATSMVAAGHVAVMAARGERSPEEWFLDKDGKPSTDPNDFIKGGFIVPFGTYKGYGLSVAVAALPSFLPGLGIEGEDKPYAWGHTFMALDPAGFMSLQAFKERTDDLIRWIKSCPPLHGMEVLIPFEREWRVRERREREGIPVDKPFWEEFVKVGKEIGVNVNKEMGL